MNIVVEGPDNSGKSTLVAFLAEALKMPSRHSGGPSKYPGEVNERAERYLADPTHYIYDRHPCVSQNIYRLALGQGEEIREELLQKFYASEPLIISCKERGLEEHRVSTHAPAEHVAAVNTHHAEICSLYESWAHFFAHINYRIGDSQERIARMSAIFDPVGDVLAFRRKFKLDYDGSPQFLEDDVSQFRVTHMEEEVFEYIDAQLLEEKLDALVDLVYVAIGTAHDHCFNFREAWRRVHEANMKRVRCERVEDSSRGSTFDVIKPEGWLPPDLHDLVG